MPTVAETFAQALQYHHAGNLDLAEKLYRQILEADPSVADAHHLLGALAYQTGRFDLAITSIQHALALNPSAAAYYSNLGLALHAKGQFDDAVASYERALNLQPHFPEAHNNLANSLFRQGRLEPAIAEWREALRLRPTYPEAAHKLANALLDHGEALLKQRQPQQAVAHWQEAVALVPDFAEAHNNLGNTLLLLGQTDQAILHCREALRLRPDFAEAHNNLANAYLSKGQPEQVVKHCEAALRLLPDFTEAYYNLGIALRDLGIAQHDLGLMEKAAEAYRQALRLQPDFPAAHNNLGDVLRNLDQQDLAMTHWHKALELRPDYPEPHYNLGKELQALGRLDEALAHYEQTFRVLPDYADARWNRSLVWLARGEFERGWLEYEWRWTQPEFTRRPFKQPLWDGSPLGERTILIYAEQGLGDTLQFIRYIPQVKDCGGRTIVYCHPPLLRMLAGAAGIDQLLPQGVPLPPFDVQVPLLSLPGILQTTLATVPSNVPYLHADAQLMQHWQRQLGLMPGFKIGIAWQGSPIYKADQQRSIPLTQFTPLGKLPGVRMFSLQKAPGHNSGQRSAISDQPEEISDQVRALADQMAVHDFGSGLDEAAGAFMDTAAIMMSLDLIITSDTAVAHLAGALGVPVWVALPYVADWRWLLLRADSPWYPDMRLFRQTQYGKWEGVFESMAAELASMPRIRTC